MAKNDSESQLLRGALIPSFAVGVVAIAIATFLQGKAGFFGALLAQRVCSRVIHRGTRALVLVVLLMVCGPGVRLQLD